VEGFDPVVACGRVVQFQQAQQVVFELAVAGRSVEDAVVHEVPVVGDGGLEGRQIGLFAGAAAGDDELFAGAGYDVDHRFHQVGSIGQAP
jgi:hypothetical protein